MAVAITLQGETIRVEWLIRWYGRLASLPFLGVGGYFLGVAVLMLRDDVTGLGRLSEDWGALLVCLALALFIGTPGLLLATLRTFVDVDKVFRQIVVVRQFGPLRIRSLRQLVDYTLVTVTDDGEPHVKLRTYNVNLCGTRGTRPIVFSAFSTREEANMFARDMGQALRLPARDLVGTPPDDPDL